MLFFDDNFFGSKQPHTRQAAEEREQQGISDGLLRFSVGIEDKKDLIADMQQAFEETTKSQMESLPV